MQKLPVPNITLNTQDQGAVFQGKMNALADACKSAVQAFNNQIDAAQTAQQFSDSAQQALMNANVTPILQRLGMTTKVQPTLVLDFVNNDYRRYEPFGLTPKTLTDLLATTRASSASFNSPFAVENTAANIPRIEYDPATGECLGLLCEEQRTNLLLRSQELSNSSWSKLSASAYTVTEMPNGFSRILISNNVSSVTPLIFQNIAATIGQTWALSFKINKAFSGLRYCQIETSNGVRSLIDVQTGAVIVPASNSISVVVRDCGSYWKVEIVTSVLTTLERVGLMPSTLPSIAYSRDYVAGQWAEYTEFQLELGQNCSSYMKTESSQVTRASELSFVGAQLNSSEGTFYVKSKSPKVTNFQNLLGLGASSTEEFRVGFGSVSSSSTFRAAVSTAGQTISTSTRNLQENQMVKVAVKYKQSGATYDFKMCVNGVLDSASISVPGLPTGFLQNGISLGGRRPNSNSLHWGKAIEKFTYTPRALSDQELIELTRI